MASPILPSLGLGSGLNTTAIVEALVNAEKTPKQSQLDRRTSANTASISAVGGLKSALTAFKSTLEKLNSATDPAFLGSVATSSNDKTVKATAGSSAVNGSYSVQVSQLATASRVASDRYTDSSSVVSASGGTLTLTQNGTSFDVTIPAGATLQQTRDAINAQATSKGYTANIVNDGQGSRLVLSSDTMGKDSDISVTGVMTIDPAAEMTAAGGSGRVGELAKDAEFNIDGMALTSKSNKVENAISGMTFELLAKTDTNSSVSIGVTANTDGLKTSLQSFVDAYNSLVLNINTVSKSVQGADGTWNTPALAGDSAVRSILTALRNELVVPATSGSGQLTVLSQLGINTSQASGMLEFDSTKFTKAINDQKLGGEVQNLFNGDGGVLDRMTKAMEPFSTSGGVLDTRNKSLESAKKSLELEQTALDARIKDLEASLTKKYNNMDTLVGQLNSQRDTVTSIFEAMAAQQKNS
ncbi:flagellar filament capping protein FliD [Pseudomonas fakonensis]|uniref:Flagellar hook-associated protein 2 n=1 Tax=Pseudomonas fakonensis TaxID=2842355 RepID=A0ABX8N256_9PSED|nr:flagellar filament capping protein FliD [Pseudomonas fakonensis]QXH50069.1 flagellar filament capping protein FliD [Pseudomonas fakonensis]